MSKISFMPLFIATTNIKDGDCVKYEKFDNKYIVYRIDGVTPSLKNHITVAISDIDEGEYVVPSMWNGVRYIAGINHSVVGEFKDKIEIVRRLYQVHNGFDMDLMESVEEFNLNPTDYTQMIY